MIEENMAVDLTGQATKRYATAFLFKTINPSPEEKPVDTWSFTYTQKENWEEMMDDFHKRWGIMEHSKSLGIRHSRLVCHYVDRSPAALIGKNKGGRRLRNDNQILIYVYGMSDADANSPSPSTSSNECKRKRNFTDFTDFYKKRNRVYDMTRDGAIIVPDETRKEDDEKKLREFKEKVAKKHPAATVVNASKVKCGECGKVFTLSVPYGTHIHKKTSPGSRHINASG